MLRRNWILSTAGSLLSAPFTGWESSVKNKKSRQGSFAIDGNHIRFFHPSINKKFSILMIADTHLFRDDERGAPYLSYSARMAKAYNHTKHFKTGLATNPENCFQESIQMATEKKVDLLALVGDLFSFPSPAAVDWVEEILKKSGLNYVYTAGNHDWHYEGMQDSLQNLRATWTQKHLLPMYQQEHPLMSVREINGVKLVAIDNSTYQILPEQLEFLQLQLASGMPLLLLLHIPLFAPDRPVSFGCGHPLWNAASDKNAALERRESWPAQGHTATTMAFHQLVFGSPQVMGILAGHIHAPSLDVVNGLPQFVTEANAVGGFLEVDFLPS
jgi:hypothetical protein